VIATKNQKEKKYRKNFLTPVKMLASSKALTRASHLGEPPVKNKKQQTTK
jgi:hypothetical protein